MDCILADKLLRQHDKPHKRFILHCVMLSAVLLMLVASPARAESFGALFGYSEVQQENIADFPQWQSVVEEEATIAVAAEDCANGNKSARCLVKGWKEFLTGLQDKPAQEQLNAVNTYVNAQDYVGDKKNYGREDYWADPATFLENGGDCEDFAILKYFSLKALGWATDKLRVVVVQDTALRQPHAVLAVATDEDVLILDNQKKSIVSEDAIGNYAPLYSLTDDQWWLHLPRSMYIADNS